MWSWFKVKGCRICDLKDEFVKILLEEKKQECIPCKNFKEQISYLHTLIDKKTDNCENERSEFKRTVDRLLELAGSKPVGQGHQEKSNFDPTEIKNLSGIFDEVPLDTK